VLHFREMAKEAQARLLINQRLIDAGWRLLDEGGIAANVHVECETELEDEAGKSKKGYADYLLFDSRGFPLAVIEAKASGIEPLSAKKQASDYAKGQNIRFVYLSNGMKHYFWDLLGGNPREVPAFHSPRALEDLAARPSRSESEPGQAGSAGAKPRRPEATAIVDPVAARNAMAQASVPADYLARSQMHDYDERGGWKREEERVGFVQENRLCFLRPYQVAAIDAVQAAAREGKTRFLLEMATGTGKTKTCAAIIKLFIKSGAANRVLFLVDRLELEDQAAKAFRETLAKDARTVVYKEKRNDWRKAEIVVSTVQSFLARERYREEFSPADFGLVISDEAHRSISGTARAVFEYFRGFKLGLTATPRDLLRGVWARGEKIPMELELEKRAWLDTYRIFGCESGSPTFRYGLLDGVNDGYLVNPTVVDCRTEKTTKLLSEEGLVFAATDEEGNETEESFGKRDFERRYFSDETNRAFARTFMDHALRDPVSGEIGKSLVFCVSQSHAGRMANLLNEEAHRRFPGKYRSDFAAQVTSQVKGAQDMTVAFSESKLGGKTGFLPDYESSKTRVCVTVAMMTTGYDCEDILNVALMRPVFSPSEFIQMKGRGTRRHRFAWTDPLTRRERSEAKKTFRFFDFFASYEFFETEYDYEAVLPVPVGGSSDSEGGDPRPRAREADDSSPDALASATYIEIGPEGMRIDRMFFQEFGDEVRRDPDISRAARGDDWEAVLRYIDERVLRRGGGALSGGEAAEDYPERQAAMDYIRSIVERRDEESLSDLFSRLFGRSIRLSWKDRLLDEAFESFARRHAPAPEELEDLRFFFKSYVGEKRIRDIIDSGRLPELNTTSLGTERLRRLPRWREIVRDIKAEVDLEKYGA
jgi:type I restriction enzyme, R subunit